MYLTKMEKGVDKFLKLIYNFIHQGVFFLNLVITVQKRKEVLNMTIGVITANLNLTHLVAE